jgi:pimeloyl-ACP methyl ester carboxylesterase
LVEARFQAILLSMAAAAILPPSLGLLALEGRAWFELASLLPALPLLERAPRGDGHPVLVLPGLLASDQSTRALRWFLRRRGYHVHPWRLGRNLGPTPELIQALGQRFLAVRNRHQRKVSLVGWSLGGIYARELARHFSGEVRQVITLASPFRDTTATNVARIFRLTRAGRTPMPHDPETHARLRTPPPVPVTCLYSRTDGIVAWQSCLEEEGPQRQNIEIPSSHIGMGHHPAALYIIADRLAQPEGVWRPFNPRTLPARLLGARAAAAT